MLSLTRARGARARRLILRHLPSFCKLVKYARSLAVAVRPWQRICRSSRWIGKKLASCVLLLIRHWKAAAILGSLGVLSFAVYNDLGNSVIVVEEFEIPTGLGEEIISSRGITQEFYDHLCSIRRTAVTSFKEQGQFTLASKGEAIKISYSGLEATWSSFMDYLASMLEINRPRITGEVQLHPDDPQKLTISVRRVGFEPKRITVSVDQIGRGLRDCAEHAYRDVDPYVLANYYYQMKRWAESMRQVRYCLRHEDKAYQQWAYNLQGLLFAEMQDRKGAVYMFRRALSIDAKFAASNVNLGVLFLGRSSILADYYYRRALEVEPNNYNALRNRGNLYMSVKRYDRARYFLERSLALYPRSPHTHLALAVLYKALDEPRMSNEHLAHALDILSAGPSPHIRMSGAFAALGNLPAAEWHLLQGLLSEPDNGNARARLAEIQAQMGKCDLAKKNASKALSLVYPSEKFAESYPYDKAQGISVGQSFLFVELTCKDPKKVQA
jgi:tetratricopeptide (TPR) repeat protein